MGVVNSPDWKLQARISGFMVQVYQVELFAQLVRFLLSTIVSVCWGGGGQWRSSHPAAPEELNPTPSLIVPVRRELRYSLSGVFLPFLPPYELIPTQRGVRLFDPTLVYQHRISFFFFSASVGLSSFQLFWGFVSFFPSALL